jgi:nitrogen-specific signal transduction histidine kinase
MIHKNIRFIAISLFSFLLTSLVLGGEAEPVKKILVLNSYHETYHWTDRIMTGVKSVFKTQDDVELFVCYMDTKRSSDEAYFKILRDVYAYKYARTHFDAIISTDDHALNFLLHYRDELFPGVPVFFCGINDFQPARIEGQSLFSGVYESYDVAGTVDLMLQIHPQTKTLVTIVDDTVSGHAFLSRIKRAEPKFSGRIKFEYLHDRTPEELCEALRKLPPDALVLWAIYIRTPAGVAISSNASVRMIAKASPVPVYCIWDVVGQGVVGGKITSPNFQGQAAAEMASRFLRGSRFDSLPVSGSPMIYAFDYTVMQRFGITEKRLPPGSIILNHPYSVYREYRRIIWGTLGTLVLLITIILLLIHYILTRRQAEKELAIAQEQLAQGRKMEAIGQLAGGIAHDFNNMLAGISGAAETFELKASPQDQKLIDIILTLTEQASQLTAKLLAFGRKGNVVLEPTDLHHTLHGVIDILAVSLNKAVTLDTQLNASHSIVMADESQITNALLNMGINAEHSMPDGGRLIFKTSIVTLALPFCEASAFELHPGRVFCI